jgi:hypothetical protein
VRVVASFGAGFLLAVLWFDLMFDVQVRGRGAIVPAEVLGSIARYYRRVTTTSRPMSGLVAAVMALTVGALVGEVVQGDTARWVSVASLALTAAAVGLAAAHTVRMAVRLGAQTDDPERQSELARSIYREHLLCLVAITATVVLQVLFA